MTGLAKWFTEPNHHPTEPIRDAIGCDAEGCRMLWAIPFALRPGASPMREYVRPRLRERDGSTLVKIPSGSRRRRRALPGTSPGCATAPFREIVPVGVLFSRLFVHVSSPFCCRLSAPRGCLPTSKSSLMAPSRAAVRQPHVAADLCRDERTLLSPAESIFVSLLVNELSQESDRR